MKVPDGCVICQSTWGNYWAEVEGQKMFFCCVLCEIEFRNMLNEIRRRTGWRTIDEIEISGDTRGRECSATSNGKVYRFQIRFNSRAGIADFNERKADPSTAPSAGGHP